MRQTSMDDTLKTQFFTLKFDFYNFNSIHDVEQQFIRESIAEVFVTKIKGHEVSNHSATAMLFNQPLGSCVAPECRLVASIPQLMIFFSATSQTTETGFQCPETQKVSFTG